ncbi:MAG: hypothetical protein LBK13_07445 [Spirochaetales bacterium]|jgi:hypothetical protein|nr:hypothetical protein [Spirochaetales bacterium]
MYEQENAFYEANIDMLRGKYLDKELVIAGNTILGVYDDLGTAVRETVKTHPRGTFTIKHVRAKPELVRIPVYFEGTTL